jgi:hypothetical protein
LVTTVVVSVINPFSSSFQKVYKVNMLQFSLPESTEGGGTRYFPIYILEDRGCDGIIF